MKVIRVYKDDMLNGEGIRVVIFIAGCLHKCKGCFNPETWSFDIGEEWTPEKEEEVFALVSRPFIKGLTISGGDALYSHKDLIPMLKRFRERFGDTKDIWLYTGFTTQEVIDNDDYREAASLCDVLCTGPFIQELKSKEVKWVGSSNQEVIKTNQIIKQ